MLVLERQLATAKPSRGPRQGVPATEAATGHGHGNRAPFVIKGPQPARSGTACTFGGPRLDQLFITTSRHGMGAAAEPAAGALFRADVAVTGLPASTFAG